jgi:uncharacterized membrane protein (DUF2068 family)
MAGQPKVVGSFSAFPAEGQVKAKKGRAPTLYGIITFKLIKGFLFLSVAILAYCLSDNDLPREYASLLHTLRVQPDARFWSMLAGKVAGLNQTKMLWCAAGFLFYSLFSLIEGFGLLFRISWAGWMAIGESAFFIPLEVERMIHRFSWSIFAILVINIIICWYLFQNRHRLFKHGH